jgi:phosphatidyl-myo-inositol dimannoside synthase
MNDHYSELKNYTHLILFDNPIPDGGGIQNMAYWLAVHLQRQGLHVVLAGQKKYLNHPAFENTGINLLEFKRPFRTTNTSDIRLLLRALTLKSRLSGKVILYSMIINNIRILRWLQPVLGWKFVSFLHGNEVLRLYHRRPQVLQKNIKACNLVLANSHYTRGIAERIEHFSNISVMFPGIPEEILCNTPATCMRTERGWQHRKIILTLSRLVKRKGHQTVIEAVSQLKEKHPEILLLVAGSGNYHSKLQQFVSESDLTEHVLFLGHVSEEEKISLYDTCDIYCMPSFIDESRFDVEGFGITFIEAASRGKIAIGGNSGGMPDAIEPEKSGFLVEPGDHDKLASLIDDIFTNPSTYDVMREYARERACRDFGWKSSISKMLSQLEAALKS